MSAIEHFWAVVPAGGAGTRLWPLSRSASPKFLHDLTGSGRSLLQETVDRLAPLAERPGARGDRRRAPRPGASRSCPSSAPSRVVAEPSPRDSMAAIGLAAALLERDDPDAVMGSFAADHVIGDPDGLRAGRDPGRRGRARRLAGHHRHRADGSRPRRSATSDRAASCGARGRLRGRGVRGEAERRASPGATSRPATTAGTPGCSSSGRRVLLDLLGRLAPRLRRRSCASSRPTPDRLDEVWPTLPRIAIDHAVAEPAAAEGRVATVPGEFGWDDIGDFHSLADVLGGADGETCGCSATPADVLAEARTGLVVPRSGRLVALVGVDDVVVVDTPDAAAGHDPRARPGRQGASSTGSAATAAPT